MAKTIYMRLRINYASKRRNLADETNAESVTSKCTIKNETLVGTEGTGENVDYDCSAEISKTNNIVNAIVNTDIPMIVDGETVELENINFNGDAAKESENLLITDNIEKKGYLNNAEIVDSNKINLIIQGSLNPQNFFKQGDKIQMLFLDRTDGEKKQKSYQCIVNKITPCVLECDNSKKSLTISNKDLHLSTGTNSGNLLTINMKNVDEEKLYKYLTEAQKDAEKVDEIAPVNTKQKSKDKKDNNYYQIIKFCDYNIIGKTINYGLYMNFLEKIIVKTIYMRLRVNYASTTRNLDDETKKADSVPSKCITNDESAEKEGTGENIYYYCSAVIINDNDIANVIIDTDIPMIFDDESVEIDYINFNGNSAKESENLINTDKILDSGTLKDAEVVDSKNNKLTIQGILNPDDLLSEIKTINMSFLDSSGEEKVPKTFNCTAEEVNPEYKLECDIKGESLEITNKDLHLSTSKDSEILLTINMKNRDETSYEFNPYKQNIKNFDRKLSGGAIAGIVLVCAAVIIAASLFAILFNGGVKPPIDNPNDITGQQFASTDNIK